MFKVKFVGVPVRDQDRARAFYTDKLGFELVADEPFDDRQRWIELAIPGAETGLVLFTPEGHEGRIGTFVNMAFSTDDLDDAYDRLLARGVEFSQAPTKAPWGSYALFKDPDGNTFCIAQT